MSLSPGRVIGLVVALAVVVAAVWVTMNLMNARHTFSAYVAAPAQDRSAPQGRGGVRVTVDGEVQTSGPGGFEEVDLPSVTSVVVRPGQRVTIEGTSKNREVNCTLETSTGSNAEHIAESARSTRDASGTWHATLTWTRPAE